MESCDQFIQQILNTNNKISTGEYKRMPNEERLESFNNQLKFNSELRKDRNKKICKHTCITDSKVGLTHKSFNPKMKPITIKEMDLGNIHRNRYIIFEIVTDIDIIVSIMFLGKDDNGDLISIALYTLFIIKNYQFFIILNKYNKKR
jgi:hypothetical protein